MIRNTIISSLFTGAVLVATAAGSNAMPNLGLSGQANNTGVNQTDVIKVHHKKKKFKKFHFKKKFKKFHFVGPHPHFTCYWLEMKAFHTGSFYWWAKYAKHCMNYWL